MITTMPPSAADPIGLQIGAGFSAAGNEHAVVAARSIEVSGGSGVGMAELGTCCAAGDAAGALSYRIGHGRW